MDHHAASPDGGPASADLRPEPIGNVSSTWFAAAVIGSLWASVEIVVGSFLHNIHLPLAGTILSAFGVLLLVSFDRLIPSKGLFWRSGAICAAMKTLSPSAVILGPIVGILCESLLLEGSVFFLGRTVSGYILGGALAVSWSLIQKLIGTVILYGANIIALYEKMVDFAATVTGLQGLSPPNLLIAFLLIDLVLGGTVAAVGLAIGRWNTGTTVGWQSSSFKIDPAGGGVVTDRYSMPMLVFFLAGIAGGLTVLGRIPTWQGAGWTAMFCGIVVVRHPQITRQFMRPRLWVEMVVITLLAGLFLGGVGRVRQLDGIVQGVEMCLRAVVLVSGFAAVGVELRNPVLASWFGEHGMSGFVTALKIAFGALPIMISITALRPEWLRHPLRNISDTIHEVYRWTVRMRGRMIIVSGDKGSGKTTFVSRFVQHARERGLHVGGFLAEGLWKDGTKRGFELHELATGKQVVFCSMDGPSDHPVVGRYYISPEGLAFGRSVLSPGVADQADLVVVDEVGPLELGGEGWAESLDRLILTGVPLVLVVRNDLVDLVQARWELKGSRVIDISTSTPEAVLDYLVQ
jgi:nucleoside-triphosphatase THEP1